jgi:hypothetical protein
MRSLVAKSGKVLTILGIPDLNEWHVMVLFPGEHKSDKRFARTLLKCAVVKFAQDLNRKTGSDG